MEKTLVELCGRVGELVGETRGMKEQLTKLNGTVVSNQKRINTLEDFKIRIIAIFSVVALVGSAIGSFAKDIILKLFFNGG